MRNKEDNVGIGTTDGGKVVDGHKDDVERQPAAHEDGHHGDEHAISASLAPDVSLLSLAAT